LEEWRQTLAKAFARLPESYADASLLAEKMRHVFHEVLASAMQPRLNASLQATPHETYQQKQAMASWVNAELHNRLGLTIRCPRTGRSAILVADIRDAEKQASRLRLEVHYPGRKKERTYTSSGSIPELQLMEDPPRIEPLRSGTKGRST
jgi:hypothetical protein